MFPFVISLEWCDGIPVCPFRRNSCARLIVAIFFFLLEHRFPVTMSCIDLLIENYDNSDPLRFMGIMVILERKTGLDIFCEWILENQVFAFVNRWQWDVMYSELVKWCAGSCQMLLFSMDLLTHKCVLDFWISKHASQCIHAQLCRMVKVMIGAEKKGRAAWLSWGTVAQDDLSFFCPLFTLEKWEKEQVHKILFIFSNCLGGPLCLLLKMLLGYLWMTSYVINTSQTIRQHRLLDASVMWFFRESFCDKYIYAY